MLQSIMDKVFSGRFLLTIACAFVFIWATINKLLEAQAVSAILASVFASYFAQGHSNDTKPKPPAAGAVAMILACLIFTGIPGNSYADTTPVATPPSITQILNTMGAQPGYFYGVRARHGYSYLATTLANIGPATWHLTLDGGLIATSGAALTVDYDLLNGLSLKQVPVLGFFDALKVGGGVMVTDITFLSDSSTFNGTDNRFDAGGDALFLKKW